MNTINTLKKYRPEILGVILCVSLGFLSGYLSQSGDTEWYLSLQKPPFNPPSWIFAPVWTVLYIMMGIALAKLWRDRQQRKLLLSLFAVQLILNLLWTPLFFYFHRIDLALMDISLLWISLAIFLTVALKVRTVYWLFSPYFLWVSFAWVLNYSIYTLNI